MLKNKIQNLKELPQIKNRISFLHLQHGRIEQDKFSIQYVTEKESISIPCANINVLLLGPGISITHAAIVSISQCKCLCVWCGENNSKFYAYGQPFTNSSENLLKQVKLHSNSETFNQIATKMYSMRYGNIPTAGKTIAQLRGIEGIRVKQVYKKLSEIYQIKWVGRRYEVNNYSNSDNINKAITYTNQILYAIVQSVIMSLGYSPSLGFIHSGNVRSFVFDIADLYKEQITLPVAFRITKQYEQGFIQDLEQELRKELRLAITKNNLMEKIIEDINTLFAMEGLAI